MTSLQLLNSLKFTIFTLVCNIFKQSNGHLLKCLLLIPQYSNALILLIVPAGTTGTTKTISVISRSFSTTTGPNIGLDQLALVSP